VSLVVNQALVGHAWAVGLTILLAALVMAFVVYAAAFAGVSMLADVLDTVRRRGRKDGAPIENENRRSSSDPAILAVLLLLVPAFCSQTALAASGTPITLPILGPGQSNVTGLTLTVDTTWVDSSGYRPVRIEVKSITGPVAADRVLTIRFRPK